MWAWSEVLDAICSWIGPCHLPNGCLVPHKLSNWIALAIFFDFKDFDHLITRACRKSVARVVHLRIMLNIIQLKALLNQHATHNNIAMSCLNSMTQGDLQAACSKQSTSILSLPLLWVVTNIEQLVARDTRQPCFSTIHLSRSICSNELVHVDTKWWTLYEAV